jgi:peptide-methionine (R)-S-oxide reductase
MSTYNKNPEAPSRLTPEQYRVTQTDGTERSFANEYWEEERCLRPRQSFTHG